MEIIKKEIIRKMIIVEDNNVISSEYDKYSTEYYGYYYKYSDTKYKLVPDLNTSYNIKFGLYNNIKELGFFDVIDE